MADYSTLKAAIRAVIRENGNEEITGTVLQGALISMINTLGAGYTFMGVATPSTNPGTPDYDVAYLAGPGVYPNFDGVTVLPQNLAVLKLNGDEGWAVELIQLSVVDNLTTDNPAIPLSAAQGKVLNDKIEIRSQIQITPSTHRTSDAITINVNNYWQSSSYYPALIPVTPGQQYKIVKGSVGGIIAYLKDNYQVSGQQPHFCTGYGARISITEDMTIVIPSDANYLYWLLKTSQGDVNSTLYLFNGVSGLREDIEKNASDIASLEERMTEAETDIADLQPDVKNIVSGADYTTTAGNINQYGILSANSSYWYSSPIAVKAGDIVHLVTQYQGSGMAIGLTDSTGSYYKPLANHSSTKDYTANIEQDGYIAIGYITGETPTTFTITSSPQANTMAEAKNFAELQDAIEAGKTYDIADTNESNAYKSRTDADIAKAQFDRERMIAEVAGMTDADILVQGSCGYSEAGGVVTDGTITWKIYKGGILYISGYGKFYDFIKGTGACMNIAGVNAQVSSLGEEFWYYGFVNGNVNGITPPFSADKQKYDNNTGDVMTYSGKRYVPFGEQTNPLNNKPYGYAAPWYIYRTDIDWTYQSKSAYNSNNPNGIKYNRICIVEDTANGGITYVGNWTFYRATADSLILPSRVTKIGCWGVRYSPVMHTVVMGDLVTEIEDHGVSRMLALRSLHISNALVSFGYAGMEMDAVIEYVKMPASVTTIGSFMFNGCPCLTAVDLPSVTALPYGMATLAPLSRVTFPEAESAGLNSVYGAKIKNMTIPDSLASIDTDAFRKAFDLQVVILQSATIAAAITITNGQSGEFTKFGAIFGYCDYILMPVTITTISSWFYRFFKYLGSDGTYNYFSRDSVKLSA